RLGERAAQGIGVERTAPRSFGPDAAQAYPRRFPAIDLDAQRAGRIGIRRCRDHQQAGEAEAVLSCVQTALPRRVRDA
ncbi:MAG TPA: hypothetical protein PK403_15770, partial [Plasticicumulans sp.]|nr:hypothetical protein [Plasticicumulans sp.]